MNITQYKNEIKNDILEYAEENKGNFDSLESFRDACWIEDSITGNGSGSYTFNTAQAEENVKDLIFTDELREMFEEFGFDRIPLEKGAEWLDVSIRCFLLDECLANVEDEVKELLGIDE